MKKLLPFDVPRRSPFTRSAAKDSHRFDKELRALVKRFGFRAVLRGLVDLAGDETLLSLKQNGYASSSYREAATLLDHAEKTLDTIVRLETQLTKQEDELRLMG